MYRSTHAKPEQGYPTSSQPLAHQQNSQLPDQFTPYQNQPEYGRNSYPEMDNGSAY